MTEAIAHLRQKVRLPTRTWTDLWEGMHARAFVVAGAMKDELVADFHQAILKAIEKGTTLAEFRKDFDRIVQAHGWSYRGGRGWRSAVIYNTNLRMAHASGRWAQIQRLKDRRPYLRYSAVLDGRTRPDHRAWHGTVLPADHGWWTTHYPPNGWNCRCTVQQLSAADVERLGYRVSDEAPVVEMEERQVNTPGGQVTVRAPKGIDTGFGYNAGEAAWGRGQQAVALERHGGWEPLDAPGGRRPVLPGRLQAELPRAAIGGQAGGNEERLREMLRRALGGDEAIFTDPTGARTVVGQAIVDHMLADRLRFDGREAYFPFIRELVETPAEIWVGFARDLKSGRVSIRRRYVKLLRIKDDRHVTLVADQVGGQWAGMTFFRGGVDYLDTLRSGLRIYQR